jgi:oligopeptide transport system ATP-binding protein
LARTIIRLHQATQGEVFLDDQNFFDLQGAEVRRFRKKIQMIFQDPFASLNPRMTIRAILNEPLKIHKIGDKEFRKKRVHELITLVGLQKDHLNRYPHEFSGGQRQRISIARCLALNPEIIIADEPVSALDVSIQAQILNLMKELQQKLKLTYLFISHDLSVIQHMCDEIAVMYLGKVIEMAKPEIIFNNPQHPYTKVLMNSIPGVHGKSKKAEILQSDLPSPLNLPKGCAFHPRCSFAEKKCCVEEPSFSPILEKKNHLVKCHLA